MMTEGKMRGTMASSFFVAEQSKCHWLSLRLVVLAELESKVAHHEGRTAWRLYQCRCRWQLTRSTSYPHEHQL